MLLVAMGMKGEPLTHPSALSLPSPFSFSGDEGHEEEVQEGEGKEWSDEMEEQQGDAYAAAMAMVATTFRYDP